MENRFSIRPALPRDERHILSLIRELAEYENLTHECVATEDQIRQALFGDHPKVFSYIVDLEGKAIGFCLYFYNFSTFLGRPGIYLEDLYGST